MHNVSQHWCLKWSGINPKPLPKCCNFSTSTISSFRCLMNQDNICQQEERGTVGPTASKILTCDRRRIIHSLSTSRSLAWTVFPCLLGPPSVLDSFRYARRILFGSKNSMEKWNRMNVSLLSLFRAVDLSSTSRPNHGHQMCCTELIVTEQNAHSRFRKKLENTYLKSARRFNINWPLQIKSSIKDLCRPRGADKWTLAAV